MKQLSLVLLFLVPAFAGLSQTATSSWEKSVVRVEASRKSYDYYQPWNRRNEMIQKVGLVVGKNEILTTADDLSDATLVRMQKGGRGAWVIASIVWVDYFANLAVLTTDDANFWADLTPAPLDGRADGEGAPLQIVRWREGKLESRRAEFTQFTVLPSQLSELNHVHMEADSEIQGAGYAEPVVANSHVIGLVASQGGRTCNIIPASFLRMILEARHAGNSRGLGYFHFFWQPSENTATLEHLKLPGRPRGVLVIDVPERIDGRPNVLKPQDIILEIDGFAIDMQGDYNDPEFGPLILENLAVRNKWAGDEVKIKIWRDGQSQDITYQMPKYDFTHMLVPGGVFDQPPDYLIVGGLVFQPLTVPYLQRWGSDWQRNAPFRLNYYREDEATKARPALIILSQVLPDKFNIGYQEQRALVVDKVNQQKVHTLAELQLALRKPTGDFHIIDFVPNEQLQRIVLAAGRPEAEATARILERFSITAAAQITPPNTAAN